MADVAPLVGAWIEIAVGVAGAIIVVVAPLVGAWIEIIYLSAFIWLGLVAPLVGAWIEISQCTLSKNYLNRRTPRGCVD